MTLTSEQLTSITGLSDRRHRQLAEQGFLPRPANGLYLMEPTLSGIIRYYKSQLDKKNDSAVGLEMEQTRLTTARADLAEVERARARKEVIETESVFQLWENIGIAIRRIILTSALTDAEKDSILDELRSFKLTDVTRDKQSVGEGTSRGVSGVVLQPS